ncbi:cyclopropane fatty-acyl-phospholipid synthase-like methyltransferase [Paenibacillus sp. DS2015]|uniref:class I SAM-dependent methyltransferase n=1 Tax=Paenibacillus sp. DS2015 TaxID=3373917 RepID=UPI003D1F1FA0
MNQANFDEARKAEANYHNELYSDHEILEPGTWMSKPVPIVMELLERILQHKDHVTVLDLGCGAGRNTIPLAVRLKGTNSRVVGIDLLEEAIEKLRENSNKYDVADVIEARKGDAEQVDILEDAYDYIAACGCLEHVSSEEAFIKVLERMKMGTRLGGIHCITMNTDIQEVERETGRALETLIELNLPTEKAFSILEEVYDGWNVLDRKTTLLSIDEEKYEKPSQFRCQSITFAVQKI